MVSDEWTQLLTSGYAVEKWRGPVAGAVARRGADAVLADRIHGAWLGRCAGCCAGKPVEGLTRTEVSAYLAAAGGPPLTDYLPLLDPLPAGVAYLHESAPVSARGCFDATPRDDDLDWTILGLHLLETDGPRLSTADIAQEWLDRMPFTQTYTAERAAYRNLVRGLHPPQTASVDNPYREWIGALIRADAWAYTHPGNPARAVDLAITDATLSHVGNGIATAIAAGLLWGAGDFARTIELTLRAGADTDSNCATAGSVFGALHGTAALPAHWIGPLRGLVRSAVRDFDRSAVADLAARTARLALAWGEPP